VPESKPRKKKFAKDAPSTAAAPKKPVKVRTTTNPAWLVPTMVAMFIIGILWVVLFYLTSGGARLPIPAIGQWNIAVGFLILLGGFGLSTRWK
jgi:Cell division protein CrgA